MQSIPLSRASASTLALVVVLTALPFTMNAFPHHFANAFSEHFRRWSLTSLLLMTATLAAWSGSLVLLAATWRRRSPATSRERSGSLASPPTFQTLLSHRLLVSLRWPLICHGPILVGLFYAMWFSARLSLGRWPYSGGRDDPKSIAVTWLIYWAICCWFWVGALALAAPLVRVGAAARQVDRPVVQPLLDFVLTCALLFGALVFIAQDPHELLTWFLD